MVRFYIFINYARTSFLDHRAISAYVFTQTPLLKHFKNFLGIPESTPYQLRVVNYQIRDTEIVTSDTAFLNSP